MAETRASAFPLQTVRNELHGVLMVLLMVAATTVVVWLLHEYLDVRRGSVVYLIPVLLAGWHLGRVPALLAAILGVVWSGYFFYSSDYPWLFSRPYEMINLLLFMIVALVTSHLANRMKIQAELARKRGNEMSDLYAFSRRLAAAPSSADIYRAIEEHLAALVQRKVILFAASRGEPAPDSAVVPAPVRSAIEKLRKGSTVATTVDDGAGNSWLIRRVSERNPDFGVIAVDLGSVSGGALADIRQRIDEVLSDATATLERLDVAHALDEARMRSETELLREALIGSVSHELRTPLASILGAATVLRSAPAIASDTRLNSLAGVVRDEAERLNNDIQNLLDATRISRQQVKPHLEWIEPSDIVNGALERRQRRLAAHKVALEMDSNLPFIRVDPMLVQQAFVQVVDNAAKYSPPGSTINVSAKRNSHSVILAVNDHGAGLTPEETKQLGERFFRGPRLAATTSGSGLGLWIARAFVQANGGQIEASSAGVDRGTTVSIHLPVAPDAPPLEASADD